jgi:DnaJ-class molecular chaperone
MSSPPNANYATQDCKWCNATGLDRDQRSTEERDLCLLCSGTGSVAVMQPARVCANCQGSGSDPEARPPESEPCPACKGSGWAQVYRPA